MYNPYFQGYQAYPPRQDMFVDKNAMKCRAVTSQEEAKAAMIDLDGSVSVFTDLANKKIYTKQINLDGTATLNTYVLSGDEQPKTYVDKEELTVSVNGMNEKMDSLSEKVRKLSDEVKDCKRMMRSK